MDDHNITSKKTSYQDAGVDIGLADSLIQSLLPEILSDKQRGRIGSPLGFGSMFEVPTGYDNPVLVSGTDGVGTKLKIAFELDCHETIGIDLVAMCVNDVIVSGAKPLYFLDYFATGKLQTKVAKQVITGIINGCEIAGISLIGGETAEMPGMYSDGEYDVAGFCVGIVEKRKIIDGSQVRAGDSIVSLASSGVHSNGYSLIRKLIADFDVSLSHQIGHKRLVDWLIEPTYIYVNAVQAVVKNNLVHALAHITGGGITGNVSRVIPNGLAASIDTNSWRRQPVFEWIQKLSKLSDEEMLAIFNCGVGMAAIIDSKIESQVRDSLELANIETARIGTIVESVDSDTKILLK